MNHVLSCHSFRFLLLFFRSILKVVSNCGAQDNGTFIKSCHQQHVICIQTSKRTSFEQLFHLDYFTLVGTANTPRLLYLVASWLAARWFLGGVLVGGEMVSWWRVGWCRDGFSLVACWLVPRWFQLGGELVGSKTPWWRDDCIP